MICKKKNYFFIQILLHSMSPWLFESSGHCVHRFNKWSLGSSPATNDRSPVEVEWFVCLGPGFHEEAAASGGGVDAGGSLVSVKRLAAVKLTMLKRNTKDYSNSVLTAV